MIKELLLKIANKIIDKYGVHILDNKSIIQIWDTRFKIQNYSITKSISDYTMLNLEARDIICELKYKN